MAASFAGHSCSYPENIEVEQLFRLLWPKIDTAADAEAEIRKGWWFAVFCILIYLHTLSVVLDATGSDEIWQKIINPGGYGVFFASIPALFILSLLAPRKIYLRNFDLNWPVLIPTFGQPFSLLVSLLAAPSFAIIVAGPMVLIAFVLGIHFFRGCEAMKSLESEGLLDAPRTGT